MEVWGATAGAAAAALVVGAAGICFARTLATPAPVAGVAREPLADAFLKRKSEIAERLAAAIRRQTVSVDEGAGGSSGGCACHAGAVPAPRGVARSPPSIADTRQEFLSLHSHLQSTYPLMHSKLERHVINDLSLAYVWWGSDRTLPAAGFAAHLDVVPASAEEWSVPPFEGRVSDGHVWGRGAMYVTTACRQIT
jgi:acetylornithine deacetylase/succinyl-diaminopimelate desuccinylase-like protein